MKIKNDISKIFKSKGLFEISTAVMSEGMLSASNFVINIIMAKYAEKTEYGMYVVLFSLIGILAAFQHNIINAPMMVIYNRKREEEKKNYTSSLAEGKNYLFVPMLILLMATGIIYSVMNHSEIYFIEFSVLFVVTMLYISKEFVRVCHFIMINTKAIFRMDFFNVAGTLLGMAVLVCFDVVSSLTGIIVLGFGYLVSWIFARSKGMYIPHRDKKSVKEALKENWQYGKWALLGSASSLLQNRGYIYIVSAELGLSEVAEISAARLFLVPIGLLNFSSGKIAVAKGSKYLSLNKFKELNRLIFYFIATLMIIGVLYFLFVLVASDDIVGYLGEKYGNIYDLIWLWCIFFFVYTIRVQLATPLTIYSKFRELAKIDIWGSSVAIVSCFILIGLIGRSGAIISLAIGETLTAILYLRLLIRIQREYQRL